MPRSSGVGNGSSRTSASVSHASASSFFASCSGPLVRTSGGPTSAASASRNVIDALRARASPRRRTRRGASPGSTPRTPGSLCRDALIVISRARCFSSNAARAPLAETAISEARSTLRAYGATTNRCAAQRELGLRHLARGQDAHLHVRSICAARIHAHSPRNAASITSAPTCKAHATGACVADTSERGCRDDRQRAARSTSRRRFARAPHRAARSAATEARRSFDRARRGDS